MRPFKKISNAETNRIMREAYVTYAIQAEILKDYIATEEAIFNKFIAPEKKVLAELNARMASLMKEKTRE